MSEHTVALEVWDDPSRAFVQMTRYNPPGRRALTYRGAPYQEALARMLAGLPRQSTPDKPEIAPLGKLNIADRHDWTVALLQAWAVVTDVLTFYQERVTNEGYLSTAVEDRSVLELTRAIGYTISPGVSAETQLAFTVTKRPDQPNQVATLPANLAVQSTATPGSLAQLFETSEPFTARSEWNALQPIRYHDVRWRRDLREDAAVLRFAGVQTGLSVGDRLVIVSQPWLYRLTSVSGEDSGEVTVAWQDENDNPVSKKLANVNLNDLPLAAGIGILLFEDAAAVTPETPALLVQLTTANPVPATGTTTFSWDDPIEGPVILELGGTQWGLEKEDRLLVVGTAHGQLDPAAPRLVVTVAAVQAEPSLNRTTVHLEQDPRGERRLRAIPNPRVAALRQQAALFTYTSSGLFAKTGRGVAWRPQGIGLPDAEVRDIIRQPSGALFAATAKGLFRSSDEGASWQALPIGLVPREVHALARTEQDYLLVGTDKGGIFLSKDNGANWLALSGESVEPFARGLRKWFPQFYTLDSLPSVVVRDLIVYKAGRRRLIAAATDVGVFRSTDGGRSWRPTNQALPDRDKKTGLADVVVSSLTLVHGKHLFAATSAGVYHILDRLKLRTVFRYYWYALIAFFAFHLKLLGELDRGAGPLFDQINSLLGAEGWVGQLISRPLNWYISVLITLTPHTAALVILAALMLLSFFYTLVYWGRYLEASERIGIAAFRLLNLTAKSDSQARDRLYAATQAGVFEAESASWMMRLLGRPVRGWRPINTMSPLFALDIAGEIYLGNAVRKAFQRHGNPLPPDAVVYEERQWQVVSAENETLYTLRPEAGHLQVYAGNDLNAEPRFIIPVDQAEMPERGKPDVAILRIFEHEGHPLPANVIAVAISPGPTRQWRIKQGEETLYTIRRASPYLQVRQRSARKDEPVGRLTLELQEELAAGAVPEAVRLLLSESAVILPDQAIVVSQEADDRWLIFGSETDGQALAAIHRVTPVPLVYRREVPPLFLIEKSGQMCDDLDEENISPELRSGFDRHLVALPAGAEVERVERGKRWLIRGDDRQVLVSLSQLDDTYLLAYQGLLTPVGVLPPRLQATLDKGDISEALRGEFEQLKIEPQDSQQLFVAFPGLRWYLLNHDDVPVYEIWRIGVRLVVMKPQSVHALDNENGDLLAGTASGEVHRRQSGIWRRTDAGLALTDVRKIKTVSGTQYIAGTPPAGSSEKEWTSFHINRRYIDLDRIYPALQPESLLLLQQIAPWREAVYSARRVTVDDSADLLKLDPYTRVEVDREAGLEKFDRTVTTVWGQSEPLALYDDRPVSGDQLVVAHPIPGLEAGKRLVVRGKPMRARIVVPGLVLEARTSKARATMNRQEVLKVLEVAPCPDPPQADTPAKRTRQWRLQNADRFVGTVEAGFDEIVLEPAADDDSFVNELVELAAVAADASQTVLTFKKPLGTYYDRSTVTVLANIVPATHGQTIADEVLGSSQGAVSYERFRLRQEPLTYLASARSSAAVSTLHVYVNGVEWQPEPFFSADLEPDDRAFVLHGDERGGSTIIFGDGINGARLPPNSERLTVSYRIGSGAEGNVPADSLTNLRTRVANLQGVTNPLPASGGVGREAKRRTRQQAPRQARASQRIVSLTDYADFTAAYPGIGKAHAELMAPGSQPVIRITVADRDGQPIATESMLFSHLRQAIDAQRASHRPAVVIQSFSPVFFNVSAALYLRPDHYERHAEIKQAAHARLAASFGFEQRELGQMVSLAEVIAVLHSADEAITGVKITDLKRADDRTAPDTAENLRTREPRELLMINAKGEEGIVLRCEVAS